MPDTRLLSRPGRRLAVLFTLFAALWMPIAARSADAPPRDYLIGAGDIVRITVYQSPDPTLDARVAESGVISYPLLGTVRLGGLSVAQAEAAITRGLRDGNFLKQPQVTVLVTQLRGNQVSVLGLVNKPGRFPIDVVGMRLSEALALAGGVAQGGNDVVTLSSERDGKAFRSEIDLPALYGQKPSGEDPVLQNGDVVLVGRAPTVLVSLPVSRRSMALNLVLPVAFHSQPSLPVAPSKSREVEIATIEVAIVGKRLQLKTVRACQRQTR